MISIGCIFSMEIPPQPHIGLLGIVDMDSADHKQVNKPLISQASDRWVSARKLTMKLRLSCINPSKRQLASQYQVEWVINPLHAVAFWTKMSMYLASCIIPPWWNVLGSWSHSLQNWITYLLHIINAMVADGLVLQGARALTPTVMTQFAWNVSLPASINMYFSQINSLAPWRCSNNNHWFG